jgi:hypothetical protein
MSATDYLEGKLLDHLMGIAVYTPPTSLYLALHTNDPGETGSANHVTGGGYVPQLITFGAQSVSRSLSTNSQTFTNMAGGLNITHFAIRENASGGTPILYGILANSRLTVAGDPITFSAGLIAVSAD